MVEAKVTELLNCMAAFMALLIALRVLFYRRGQSRYRPLIGTCAWVIINGGFVYSCWLILYGYTNSVIAGANTLTLFYLTVQLHYSKGNLSPLLQSVQHWFRRAHL